MNCIFNTSFEVSLRVILILNVTKSKLTFDKITALDFISIYGQEFGVSEYNLHGDNEYKFSEYTTKREITSKSIKRLILKGYILPHFYKSGFKYSISKKGVNFCKKLNDDYQKKFIEIVEKSNGVFCKYSDRELIKMINNHAISKFGGIF